jgi:hypothetical protein
VAFAIALKVSLAENVNATTKILIMIQRMHSDAVKTTRQTLSAVDEEIVFVDSVNVTLVQILMSVSLDNSVNVIISRAIVIIIFYAPDPNMVCVSVDNVNVTMAGVDQRANVAVPLRRVVPRTVKFVQDMENAFVVNVSARSRTISDIRENIAKNVQPARDDARS